MFEHYCCRTNMPPDWLSGGSDAGGGIYSLICLNITVVEPDWLSGGSDAGGGKSDL
jgi:hypothetical protein